ncbi:MAG: phosphotransacetylase family protein [Desulfarculus sp.]|nr:phosphotransacetylase family protein [Desulfarculus sp.]
MQPLYVGSSSSHSGKNLVCLGLGRRFLDDGLRLAFMKPFGTSPLRVGRDYTDSDAWMIVEELGLGQTPEEACPVVRTQDLVALSLRHQASGLLGVIRAACAGLARGRDLLLLAGSGTLASGAMSGISGHTLVKELQARVVLVDRYENQHFLDNLLCTRDRLGPALLGVVMNSVDPEMAGALEERVLPFLAAEGIACLGRLPKDEVLGSLAVQSLVEMLGAKVLTGAKQAGRLVTRFFIGAMQVSHAHKFFGGVRDFGCIVGGDRPDIQLAALEGGAACLILTGNLYPSEIILSRAEELEVPVLVVRDDTYGVAHRLERLRLTSSLRTPEKIARAQELVAASLDFAALYAGLGLKPYTKLRSNE